MSLWDRDLGRFLHSKHNFLVVEVVMVIIWCKLGSLTYSGMVA